MTLYGIVGVMQSTTKQFTHQSVIAKRFGVLTVFGARKDHAHHIMCITTQT